MRESNEALAAELHRLDTHRELTEKIGRAMALEDVDGVVALVRQMGRGIDPGLSNSQMS